MITDIRQLRLNKKWFREWLNHNSDSEDDEYKAHAADVLEKWLDERMYVLQIGNLFRFDNLREYNSFKEVIVTSLSYQDVNRSDYSNYLASFSIGELKTKLNAEIPIGEHRVIGGIFVKKKI